MCVRGAYHDQMQGISLWLLVLSVATGLVFLAHGHSAAWARGSVGLQAGVGLAMGLLGAAIILVLQVDLIPDGWDLLALTVGPLALISELIFALIIGYRRIR